MTVKSITFIVFAMIMAFFASPSFTAGKSHAESNLIVVKDNSIIGKKNLVITRGEAVIWCNGVYRDPIQIIIRNYPYEISPHPLTINFTKTEDNLSTYRILVPGMVAGYFFDHSGEFDYIICGSNININGKITVK